MTSVAPEVYDAAQHETWLRELRLRKARQHPAFFLQFVHCVDAKSGEEFDFDLLTAEERATIGLDGDPGPWHWHREVLDAWQEEEVSLEYKARQIGITWLASGEGLWFVLMHPGSRFLIVSINLEEAKKVISRIWLMYQSAPKYMTRHMTLVTPARGGEPSQEIEWMDSLGRKSGILALPSTPKAGHGETAARVLLDEFGRQDYARDSWKATFPIIDGGGRARIVSTANGVSSEDTEGEAQGNFFHYVWQNAESMGIERRFHGVFVHPDRDEKWYREKARRLPASDRAEMYPRNPEEGFISTGHCWFDLDQLNAYRERWRKEGRNWLYRFTFRESFKRASIAKHRFGEWRVYEEPDDAKDYAIAADVATGTGDDFSAAYVIDLTSGKWVAEYHAKVGEDVFAKDLYYAGKWYHGQHREALLAIERQGGYGRSTILALRSGLEGRKPYNRMYRHQVGPEETIDPAERDDYGYPVNQQTRVQMINELEQWIREGLCPWITPDLDGELRTFSKRQTRPSPRALDGCNDDRVFAAAGSLDLFRLYGHHPKKRKKRAVRDRWKDSIYPWEER